MDTGCHGTGTFATAATDMRERLMTVTMATGTSVIVARDMVNIYNVAMATGTYVTVAMDTQVWYTRVQRPTRHSIGHFGDGGICRCFHGCI